MSGRKRSDGHGSKGVGDARPTPSKRAFRDFSDIAGSPARVHLNVSVLDDLYERLKQRARKLHKSMPDLLTEIIASFELKERSFRIKALGPRSSLGWGVEAAFARELKARAADARVRISVFVEEAFTEWLLEKERAEYTAPDGPYSFDIAPPADDALDWTSRENTEERAISDVSHPRGRKFSSGKIPMEAPRLWRGAREEVQNAKEFVEKVYGSAIKAGMTQVDLRRLDAKLYRAFHNWCGQNKVSPQSVLPSSRKNPDAVVARRGRRPTRAEALAALRTGTKEGLDLWKAYEALGRRERKGGKLQLN
jgi:hypothetical protein